MLFLLSLILIVGYVSAGCEKHETTCTATNAGGTQFKCITCDPNKFGNQCDNPFFKDYCSPVGGNDWTHCYNQDNTEYIPPTPTPSPTPTPEPDHSGTSAGVNGGNDAVYSPPPE